MEPTLDWFEAEALGCAKDALDPLGICTVANIEGDPILDLLSLNANQIFTNKDSGMSVMLD